MVFQPSIQTSGTYQFFPSVAEIVHVAFGRLQMRRTELLETHYQDAIIEFNALQTVINDLGPNLAQVDLQSIALTQGVATYSVPVETITILDVYLRYSNPPIDRYMWPISRTEYDSIPNKTQQGFPNQYWFDRLISPTITLYFVPDGNGPYTIYYHRFRQIQDAQYQGALNPEVPNRAIDALIAGLAHRLARIYAPQLEAARKADALEAFNVYAKQDTEAVNLYLTPAVSGYWRP
jgi:hypothetical protein